MEKNPQNQDLADAPDNQTETFNPNNAYSGSGDMQPGGATGEADKNNSAGSLDDNLRKIEIIPGSQEQPLINSPDKAST
jgi:hypothetical protein